jgi:hypothetical protein
MPIHSATERELFELAALPSDALSAVTSEALGIDVQVADISVSAFPYNWGAICTAGLWRVDVSGQSASGPASYSFFVKLLRHPRLWPHIDLVPEGPPRELFVRAVPWRIELEMLESGIADLLPPGMRAPKLHAVRRYDDDHAALWYEFVTVRPGEWTVDDYARSARLLGRLAARRRLGNPVNDRLPTYCRVEPRDGALRYYVEHRILMGVVPTLRERGVWGHPVLAKALAEVGDETLPADMVALADRLPALLDLLETLPQTYAHGDASPQNLLVPRDEPTTRVAIDWGFGTPLPVGFDLGQLLIGLVNDRVCGVDQLPSIFEAILSSYLEGLAEEGYDEDPEVVRIGFAGSVVARTGLVAVPFELLDQPGVGEHHDLLVNQLQLTRYLLDLAVTLPV